MLNKSLLRGFSFGLASGTITTLGTMVGLYAGTMSRTVVIGGILSIAIADSFSDALGIHISEESDGSAKQEDVWQATIATFLAKLFFTSTFILPFLWLDLKTGITFGIVWGALLLSTASYFIAKNQNVKPYKTILEHLSIGFLVIIATDLAGKFINKMF